MYPSAYFITWSCYGARLHGDTRGTVDRWHNAFDSPKLAPSESRKQWDHRQMTDDPFVMSPEARSIVDSTIRRHAQIRAWTIRALNVRSNHVHVVVSAAIDPETVMGQFKAWSSRRLREGGLLEERDKVWTPHGSTRYIWDESGLMEAIGYVNTTQD